MNCTLKSLPRRAAPVTGFTLVELLMAIGLGSVLMVVLMGFYISAMRSFVAMENYRNMDAKSSSALDILSREIRNSTVLTGFVSNQSLTLSNATARGGLGQFNIVTYDSVRRTLVLQRTGQPTLTNLTECDAWSFQIFTRAPDLTTFSTNIIFYPAATAAECKLIQMSWKCSRTVLGSKLNTESVQTAQIVLRNKTQ